MPEIPAVPDSHRDLLAAAVAVLATNGLFVLDLLDPRRALEIRADVELVPDTDFAFAKIAGSKYGVDFRLNDQAGDTRSIVILHPTRVVTTPLRG